MNWTSEQKPLIEAYARGYGWISLYKKEASKKEEVKKVTSRLEEIETSLKEKGVTNEQLGEVIKAIQKILAKTMDEMSEKEQDFVTRLIFGKDIQILRRPPHADKIILELAKISIRGFSRASEISPQLNMTSDELRQSLQTLANRGEVLQLNPGWDSWAVSVKTREKLLGASKTVSKDEKFDDIESNIDTSE